MSKAKLFIENFLVYGLGGIVSKIIPLIMVPIVTRLMPSTEYFGLSDLSGIMTEFIETVSVFRPPRTNDGGEGSADSMWHGAN